jgi:6-pyruvoyl-tetrahydropterin synthase
MIVDFSVVKAVIKKYDHSFLGKGLRNKESEQLWLPDKRHPHVEPSTAENFARILFEEIQQVVTAHNPAAIVKSIRVFETPSNRVTVSND